MEVAAEAELHAGTEARAEFGESGFMGGAVVGIALVGVGRGDHVLDAVGLRHAAHFEGNVPGFSAVVDLGKDVGMDVEQFRMCSGELALLYRVDGWVEKT